MERERIRIPLKAGHHRPARETFRWWADNGPTLNAGSVFQGIRTSIAEKPYIIVIFQGSPDPLPPPPPGPAHAVSLRIEQETSRLIVSRKRVRFKTEVKSQFITRWSVTWITGHTLSWNIIYFTYFILYFVRLDRCVFINLTWTIHAHDWKMIFSHSYFHSKRIYAHGLFSFN